MRTHAQTQHAGRNIRSPDFCFFVPSSWTNGPVHTVGSFLGTDKQTKKRKNEYNEMKKNILENEN
jgi:hypothetical protein